MPDIFDSLGGTATTSKGADIFDEVAPQAIHKNSIKSRLAQTGWKAGGDFNPMSMITPVSSSMGLETAGDVVERNVGARPFAQAFDESQKQPNPSSIKGRMAQMGWRAGDDPQVAAFAKSYGAGLAGEAADFAQTPASYLPYGQMVKGVAGAGQKVAQSVGRGFSKLGPKSPVKLVEEATAEFRQMLRPTQGEIKNIEIRGGKNINDLYKLAAEEQLPISSVYKDKVNTLDTLAAREKIKLKQTQTNEQLDFELSQNKSKQFDLLVASRQIKKELRRSIKDDLEYQKAARDVDRRVNATISTRGRMLNGQDFNKFKQGLWSVGYDQLRPTSQATARKMGHVAKEMIEKKYPKANVKELNELSGKYATLQHLLENAQGRVVRGGKLGGYAARGLGAIAGSSAGPIGSIFGQEAGARIASAIYAPERAAAIASKKIGKAGAVGSSFNKVMNSKIAEVVYPNIQGGPTNRLLTNQTPRLSYDQPIDPRYTAMPTSPFNFPGEDLGPTIYPRPPTGTDLVPGPMSRVRPDFMKQGKMKATGQPLRGDSNPGNFRESVVEVPNSERSITIPKFKNSAEKDKFVKNATPKMVKSFEREKAILDERAQRLRAQGKEETQEYVDLVYREKNLVNEGLRDAKAVVARNKEIDAANLEVVDYGGAKAQAGDPYQQHAAILEAAKKSGDPKFIAAVDKAIEEFIQAPRKNQTKEFLARNKHEAVIIPKDLEPLAQEARKYKTAEEFEKAFSREIKHGKYYHITDNPNFTIDPNLGPRDMVSTGGGGMDKGKLMVTSHLENWADQYPNRKYVAVIDMSKVDPKDYFQSNRQFGNEFFVNNPRNAKIEKIIPIEQALKESEKYGNLLEKNIGSKEGLIKFYHQATGKLSSESGQKGSLFNPVNKKKKK